MPVRLTRRGPRAALTILIVSSLAASIAAAITFDTAPAGALAPTPQPSWARAGSEVTLGGVQSVADPLGNTYVSTGKVLRRYAPDGAASFEYPIAAHSSTTIFALAADDSLDVTIFGKTYSGSTTFGTGASAVTIDAGDFVVRFRHDGQPRWGRRLESGGTLLPYSVASTASDVVVAGQYSGATLRIDDLTLPPPFELSDFVARLDPATGHATWLTALTQRSGPPSAGTRRAFPDSLSIHDGRVLVGGQMSSPGLTSGSGENTRMADCDEAVPGTVAFCGFIAELSTTSGAPTFVRRSSTGGGATSGVDADANGSFITGNFGTGVHTVGEGASQKTMPSVPGSSGGFIARLGLDGNVIWARAIVGTDASGRAIATGVAADHHGNAIVGGIFTGGVTFGTGGTTATSAGTNDLYLAGFGPSGATLWTTQAGASGTTGTFPDLRCPCPSVDDDEVIHVAGAASGPVTFGTTKPITVDGPSYVAAYASPYKPVGRGFHSMAPVRAFDSRTRPAGWTGPLAAGSPNTVDLSSVVPEDATALQANITVTNSSANSFLTAYPFGVAQPNASTLNFAAGETVSNSVVVRIGGDRRIALATANGTVEVVIDVMGYYGDAATAFERWHPWGPVRMLDSRTSTGGWPGPLGPGDARDLDVGLPLQATAVVVNVTVTQSTGASYLTLFQPGQPQPDVSNILFGPGQTISNQAVVRIAGGSSIRIANQQHSVQVIVDVVGWFDGSGTGGLLHPITPTRVLDDRVGTGLTGPWSPNQTRAVTVGGTGPIRPDAIGIAGNLTATNGTANSYLTAYPATAPSRPATTTLQFGAGQTIPNGVTVELGTNRKLAIYNQLGKVDVILDVNGYYATY